MTRRIRVNTVTKDPAVRRSDCVKFRVGDRVESSIKPDRQWYATIVGYYDMPGDPWHGHYAVLWDGTVEDDHEPHDDNDLQALR
jgi:hypothetical protein